MDVQALKEALKRKKMKSSEGLLSEEKDETMEKESGLAPELEDQKEESPEIEVELESEMESDEEPEVRIEKKIAEMPMSEDKLSMFDKLDEKTLEMLIKMSEGDMGKDTIMGKAAAKMKEAKDRLKK